MSELPTLPHHETPPEAIVPPAPEAVPVTPAPPPQARPFPRARVTAAIAVVAAAVLIGYLTWDDVSAHRQAARETQRAGDLAGQLGSASSQVSSLQAQVASLRTDNARLQDEARNPTLPMWNSCGGPCTIGPNSVRVGSVPDTFELRVSFTSDVPIRTYFFTFHQWTEFDSCAFSLRCVSGSYRALDPATSLDQRFSEAEGCSGYVWVLQADHEGTIKPDVSIHYMPASSPTGVCAGSP